MPCPALQLRDQNDLAYQTDGINEMERVVVKYNMWCSEMSQSVLEYRTKVSHKIMIPMGGLNTALDQVER